MNRPLDGYRILDITTGVCGPFCTQLLADFGAEVIKIEKAKGDITRKSFTQFGPTAVSYISLNRDKKSILLDLNHEKDAERLLSLAKSADIIVEDLGRRLQTPAFTYEEIRKTKEDMIWLSLTGYGQEGVFRDYPDDDAMVQALSGLMSITGENGGEFTKTGPPLADILTGIYGAIGVLAGAMYRMRTGQSIYIDAAKLSCVLSAMPDSLSKLFNTGQITRPKGSRHQLVGLFQPLRCKDGDVICMATQDHQFMALTEILGLEGLEQDERFCSMFLRGEHADELTPLIEARTGRMTMSDLMKKLLERKIPAGRINSLESLFEEEYTSFHKIIKTVKDSAGRRFRVVGNPLHFSQFAFPDEYTVDLPGEHQELIDREGFAPRESQDQDAERHDEKQNIIRPLDGIKVLDMTLFMAGPLGLQILENLGADIIKIERPGSVSDMSRVTEPIFGNTSAYFVSINSGKRSLGLNLKDPRHRDIFLKLAADCDVVTENFRPGVTEGLRLTYEDIRKINPQVIYSSVTGFGQKSPYGNRGCVDTIAQAMSGFMSLTGEEGREPIRAGSSIADVCAALYEALGILASLIWKRRTGKGGFVEAPMISAMLTVCCREAAEYLNTGKRLRGCGNRNRERGLFEPLPASDGAVMTDASEDTAFRKLAQMMGHEEWGSDPRFCTAQDRLANIEALESDLFPESRKYKKAELAGLLRRNGIPACEVLTQEEISRSGYLEERQQHRFVRDSREGWFKVVGLPLRFDRFEVPGRTFVPEPGEHSKEILKAYLGMTDRDIEIFYRR